MARPMPLVDPVTTADLPISAFTLPLPSLSFLSGPQHLDVRDAVLDVFVRGALEAEPLVELLQPRLRADAHRLPGPEPLRALQRLGHQHAAEPRAARLLRRDHAADGGLGEFHAG